MSFAAVRNIGARVAALSGETADLLILPIAKGELKLPPEAAASLGGASSPATSLLESGDFHGDPGEAALVYGAGSAFRRVLLLGMGAVRDVTRERVRAIGAAGARKARDLGVGRSLLALPLPGVQSIPPLDQAALASEGALLGTYQFIDYKTVEIEKYTSAGELNLLLPPGTEEKAAAEAVRRARVRAEGVAFARDLANTPANALTPTALAERAAAMAKEEGLSVTVMDREECEKAGMGAFLGVAKGSDEPPRFIVLEYNMGKKDAPLIALVGKGLTFDAGGISLKPALNMHEMKYDMCGAAAVLGTMKSLPALAVPVRVVAAVPATENLPSGKATKPGDVVRSFSGKTIEVLNTDAEGRLILADALSWVVKTRQPAAVVDLATLTGAVVIALGHYGAAVLSNNDALAGRIEEASRKSGERVWRLPLWEEYPEHLRSDTADLKNIPDTSAGAGTIAGGAFLKEFVGETPWAHVDIAGTAWWDKDRPHLPKGPSGYGVRLLLDLLEGYSG
jgi:leucyl aminopeptidase